MVEFYFQFDKERHQAKVVFVNSPEVEIFFTEEIICEVPVRSVLQKESPQFVMRGKCQYTLFNSKSIILTDNPRKSYDQKI